MKGLTIVFKWIGKLKGVIAWVQAIEAGLDAFKTSLEKSNIQLSEKE
nr:hypothetical protein [uncultured Draconibacterium sp.]